MNLFENIQLALAGLQAGKMRALLTMLGIIIGIGSVIAIVTVGNSLTATVTNTMSDMGVNNINIGMTYIGDLTRGIIEETDRMTDDMISDLEEYFEGQISGISISVNVGSGQAKDDRKYANVSLTGANPGYAAVNNLTITEGRFINDREQLGSRNVAVISDFAAEKLFVGESPLGKEIQVYMDNQIRAFSVVGVYKYERSAFNMSTDSQADTTTSVYIPVSTAIYIADMPRGYTSVTITSTSAANPTMLSSQIQNYLNDKYYSRNQNWNVYAFSMESMLDQVSSMMGTISTAIAVIAAISLVVGGIGVMNIMLVSVTERTREIGTRKALGARNSAIRIQFIVESVIICMFGGIIGVIMGLILGAFGASLLGSEAVFSLPVILLAVCFSMVIGVFFGYYPASKASKLDPIEALRYE